MDNRSSATLPFQIQSFQTLKVHHLIPHPPKNLQDRPMRTVTKLEVNDL